MGTLSEFMSADPELSGDTAEATPETAPEAPATEVTEGEQPAADTAPEGDATGGEWRFNSEEWDALHPELATYRKQLQADYTRAQQSLKAQQPVAEGVHEADLQWLRAFSSADERTRAAMLQQAAAQYAEPSAVPPVEVEDDYLTDTERALAERLARLEQQHDLASNTALVRNQLDALEAELGVQIPAADRQALWFEMQREGIPFKHAGRYWRGTHGFEVARRLGRDEGAKTTAAKAAMGPAPSGAVSREVEAPKVARTLAEQMEMDGLG